MTERYFRPIKLLTVFDDEGELPFRAGFLILAIDCLLIDTIQAFREGRGFEPEVSSARSFEDFLKSPRFSELKTRNDRDEFYDYVRNGLLHDGITRHNWLVRIPRPGRQMPLFERKNGSCILNRQKFHRAVVGEYRDYCKDLSKEEAAFNGLRAKFLARMDVICQRVEAQKYLFAYGSLLKRSEMKKVAADAMPVGVAFLPRYRIEFAKHSKKWGGDAATVSMHPTKVAWGCVYRLSKEALRAVEVREIGYIKKTVRPYLLKDNKQPVQIDAVVFEAEKLCPDKCGPAPKYLESILQGGLEWGLPAEWVEELARFTTVIEKP